MSINRPLLLLAGCLMIAPCWAEMDVDQADSLNFHGFHKDKKAAVKVWKAQEQAVPVDTAPVKVYDQQNPALSAPAPSRADGQPNGAATQPAQASTDNRGKRFEIRERYTLTPGLDAPRSVFYAVEALHQQMATLCPGGWQRFDERSEPVGADFYLYYGLQCL